MKNLIKYTLFSSAILLSACQTSNSVATQKLPENFVLNSSDWFDAESGDPLGAVAHVKHIEKNLYEVKFEVDEGKSQNSYFSKDKTLLMRFYVCTQAYIAGSLGMKHVATGLESNQTEEFVNPYVVRVLASPTEKLSVEGQALNYTWRNVEKKFADESTQDYCRVMFERYPLKK